MIISNHPTEIQKIIYQIINCSFIPINLFELNKIYVFLYKDLSGGSAKNNPNFLLLINRR